MKGELDDQCPLVHYFLLYYLTGFTSLHDFILLFFHYMQIINVIFAITLWTFLTSDLWVTFAHKVFGKYFKKTFTTTVFYHLSVQHIAKKYYIVFTFCLRMDGAVFIKIFHFFCEIFCTNSCFLICLLPYCWKLFEFQKLLISYMKQSQKRSVDTRYK